MSSPEDKLEETRKMLAELKLQVNDITDQKREVDTEIRAKHRELNDLNSKELVFRNLLSDLRGKLRSVANELETAEKEAAIATEQKRIAEEYARQLVELDELMTKFHWFEKAKPHQLIGGKQLAVAHRCVLADKRGLGKTLTALIASDLVGGRKVLAIVPNDVMGNFEREVRRWAPHRSVHIMGGTTRKARRLLMDLFIEVKDVFVIVNYESWRKDELFIKELIDCKFDTLIVDEAHIIKEMDTNAFRGVKRIAHAENACSKCGSSNFDTLLMNRKCFDCGYEQKTWGEFNSVQNIFPMTGTPILNKPQDIFPLLHLINPVLFRDQKEFLMLYCYRDPYDKKWKFRPGGEAALARKLSEIYVARDRHQAGVEIPEQSIQYHNLKLDPVTHPQQYEMYKILSDRSALVLRDMLAEADSKKAEPIMYMIALITRQRQMMTWPMGITLKDPKTKQILFQCDVAESIKVDYATDLINQLVNDEQERVVLFSQFKQPLIELERRLSTLGIRVCRYDGDTPRSVRQEIQIDFDSAYQEPDTAPKFDVVLAHYKTGGVGLNLNAATQMIILDEEWNPGKEDQAYGRIDRMGQTEETTVHVLRVKGTIDIWLARLIAAKREMIEGFESSVNIEQEMRDMLLRGSQDLDKDD